MERTPDKWDVAACRALAAREDPATAAAALRRLGWDAPGPSTEKANRVGEAPVSVLPEDLGLLFGGRTKAERRQDKKRGVKHGDDAEDLDKIEPIKLGTLKFDDPDRRGPIRRSQYESE